MAINSTRLRYVASNNPDELVAFISALPFKVEIKGNPVALGKKWFLFFIIPEVEGLEFNSVDLS